ncbi:MAG: nucleotidyltransferase family protein, partial [Clostridia bacterium]|nr:nucleotidyltransferase family protein [Clostridia bacterium]
NEGFVPEKLSHGVHHVFSKDGARYELHFGIPGMPSGEAGERCSVYFSDLIEKSVLKDTSFGRLRVPSDFHHGLILLLHTAHHLTNSGVGLRHLCDWAVFRASLDDEEYNRVFKAPLSDIGLWKFAGCLDEICRRYLFRDAACGRIPDGADTTDDTAEALLNDFFAGGNLGQKDPDRSREAYMITSGHENRTKPGRALALMTDMVRQKWPASNRFAVLIPVGVVFFGVRYLALASVGKRPALRLKKYVSAADERDGLYAKLELFCRE